MNFIKKIFYKETDPLVHHQFQKFGKGEFKDRALILAKKTDKGYSISTTADFANELVLFCAKKLGTRKTRVTGAIVSTSNLKEVLDFKEIKQFQGVKRYLIDKEFSGEEIISLIKNFPKAFFALSFNDEGSFSLKIKPKAPKSAKPGKGDEKNSKPDFCKIIAMDSELAKSFVFEKPDFKKANINHTYIINEIEVPEELKKSEDFALIREESKRKGIILRESEIDGEKSIRKIEFSA